MTRPTDTEMVVVVLLGLATVLTELATVGGVIPRVPLSGIPVSPAVIPGLALAVVLAPSLAGRAIRPVAAVAFWLVTTSILLALTMVSGSGAGVSEIGAVTVASFTEEFVYRLALPFVVALVVYRAGVSAGRAAWIGLSVGAVSFVLLPGHLRQMDTPVHALPFVCYAALAAWVVARSGAVLAVGLAHATTNLASLLVGQGVVEPVVRSWILAGVLGLLALAYSSPPDAGHGSSLPGATASPLSGSPLEPIRA